MSDTDAKQPWNTMPDLLQDIFVRLANREALVDGETRLTYGELGSKVQQLAGALAALGFKQGDMLAIWAPNSWQWVTSAMACWWLGGTLVPLSAKLKGLDTFPALSLTEARFLFFSSSANDVNLLELLREYLAQDGRDLEQALPHLTTLVDIDSDSASSTGVYDWETLCTQAQGGKIVSPAQVSPEDVCQIVFTTGTTGTPKGVMRCHGQTLRGNWTQTSERDYRSEDRLIVVPQFSHISGLGGLLRALVAGMTHIVVRKYQPATTLAAIEKERVTAISGPPSLYEALLTEDPDGHLLSRIRVLATGAAYAPPELIHRLLERGVGCVSAAYAMTECAILCATLPGDSVEVVSNTVGRPSKDIEVKVVDKDGREVEQGEKGEVLARGYSVMRGYYKDEEQTRKAVSPDGWLHTGDMGRFTLEGNLQIVGRIKDMIIVHGYNVFPVEVENQLMASGLLEAVAVVGQPSRFSGEECVAFVVPRENSGAERKGVLAWARKNMADFKVPTRVIVRSSLPLNLNGKLDREALRGELAGS